MSLFRKKPVVIEAMQFKGYGSYDPILRWMRSCNSTVWESAAFDPLTLTMVIGTLEGDMAASYGDWIIRGVKGEFYPCKPDIFEATYEAVEG